MIKYILFLLLFSNNASADVLKVTCYFSDVTLHYDNVASVSDESMVAYRLQIKNIDGKEKTFIVPKNCCVIER